MRLLWAAIVVAATLQPCSAYAQSKCDNFKDVAERAKCRIGELSDFKNDSVVVPPKSVTDKKVDGSIFKKGFDGATPPPSVSR